MSDDLFALFQSLDDESDIREGYQRPPLNYPGTKDKSLEYILPHLPYLNTFVDVFGGSGCVTLARKPSKLDIYNDRHSGLAAFYRCLHDEDKMNSLIEKVGLMPHSRELFTWCKETWQEEQDDVNRGAKYYYMVQSSFVGRSEYFGRVKTGTSGIWKKIQNNLELFPAIHERMKTVQIENLDWRTCFKDYDSLDTVFYLDPPYIESNIYKFGMKKAEHLHMCHEIFKLEGFVALSGFPNDIYDQFDWDEIYEFKIENRVATGAFDANNNMEGLEGTTSRDVKRTECLWLKEAEL
jgi:DNA adenine methylase